MKLNLNGMVVDTNHLFLQEVRYGYIVRDRVNRKELGRLTWNPLRKSYDYEDTSGSGFDIFNIGFPKASGNLVMDKAFAERDYKISSIEGNLGTLRSNYDESVYKYEPSPRETSDESDSSGIDPAFSGPGLRALCEPILICAIGFFLFGGVRDIGMHISNALEFGTSHFWLMTAPAIVGLIFIILQTIIKPELKIPVYAPTLACTAVVLAIAMLEPSESMGVLAKILCVILRPFTFGPAYVVIAGVGIALAYAWKYIILVQLFPEYEEIIRPKIE